MKVVYLQRLRGVVLQLLSTLPKRDESRGLKPLNTHVKELIWKRERVFFLLLHLSSSGS